MTGFDWRREHDRRAPDRRMIEVRQVIFQPPTPTTVPVPPLVDSDVEQLETEHIVRPFIVTGGGTPPTDHGLPGGTLIPAPPGALSPPLGASRPPIRDA